MFRKVAFDSPRSHYEAHGKVGSFVRDKALNENKDGAAYLLSSIIHKDFR